MRAAVGSVCALDLLLLLRRNRARQYTTDQLIRELRSSDLAVAQAVARLVPSGLVEEAPGGYRYRQSSEAVEAICDRLEAEYALRPVTIIRAMVETSDEKLRILADAFRLSGKDK